MAIEIITKPKVEIDSSILRDLEAKVQEAGQVVFHCFFNNSYPFESAIRIWSTTFLFDRDSDHKSDLVHAEKIVYAPDWQLVAPSSTVSFSLIFSGLPKSCDVFDFVEETGSETGAFIFKNIKRNQSDIYYAKIM